MSNNICIYHSPCMDGLGAAAAFYLYDPEAQFVPCQYGKQQNKVIDWLCSGHVDPDVAQLVIVDFSFKVEHFAKLMTNGYDLDRQIKIIDHHKTMKEDLLDTGYLVVDENICFDMGHSGAVLTWQYFHGDKPIPEILLDIEDRDLWKFKRQNSKAMHTWMQYSEYNVPDFSIALKELDYVQIAREAVPMQSYRDFITEQHVKEAWIAEFFIDFGDTKKVVMINCQGLLASDVAHEAFTAYNGENEDNADFACAYYVTGDLVKLSLRSDNEHEDVSAICKSFGGGGHRNAAGFTMKLIDFHKLFDHKDENVG